MLKPSDARDLLLSLCPLYEYIGLTIEQAEGGVYRCRVPLNANTGNHIQTIHAAIQWALAEFMGGLVVVSIIKAEDLANIYGAVRSASIDFSRPARSDIIAEVRVDDAETQRIGRLIDAREEARFVLQPILRDVDGKTVATFSAEYVIRPRRAG